MKSGEIKKIIQSTYDREKWRKILQFLDANRGLFKPYLHPRVIEVSTKSNQELVKHFSEIGQITTADGVVLPIFEVILNDHIQIERNRVSVNDFIKNHIVKDAIKGALATFSYEQGEDISEWRFSFISKNSASEFFDEVEAEETNPKRFTYIFGNEEQHRTAIERLFNLMQSRFTLDDFFEAFNVAPVSNNFFDLYGKFHKDFSQVLIDNPKYQKLFQNTEALDEDYKREIRNFVNRLMGRIVFLYFLQKKKWLGATSTKYDDGSLTFLSDLFKGEQNKQNDFYAKYLCPIFFNALNTPERPNDEFVLANGKTVCIPFLNGGLFEESQEPERHREIEFEDYLFASLFDFLDSFNFTVYENSPEEHTVAVDPEMLGHIFENLIDYNKDTGTFYTPKEIVQYMTRESLIQYLHTYSKKTHDELRLLIKGLYREKFTSKELLQINELLDKVKICDPAIGSGAFPMGMLMEIFNLKAIINYELDSQEWNPVKVKKNIIYNSIYGVDLDEGAIEIARLRFWLSFIVDEDKPQALPNLDYKLMQGNSLVESFRGIDLSDLGRAGEMALNEQAVMDFGDGYTGVTIFDTVSLEKTRELIEEYFDANNASQRNKKQIKKEIDDIIEGKIHAKIFQEQKDLKDAINRFYTKYKLKESDGIEGLNQKSKDVKQFKKHKKQLGKLEVYEQELLDFQKRTERPYFLWNLFFSEVLENGGFDIVIGNPPYIKEYTNRLAFDEFRNMSDYYRGKMDIWYGFASVGLDLLKENGIECFIAQNNWITSAGASILRKDVLERTEIKQFLDFGNYKVFQSAGIQTMIYLLQKKKQPSKRYEVYYAGLSKSNINKNQLTEFLNINKEKSEENIFEKYIQEFQPEEYKNKFISFIKPSVNNILIKIREKGNLFLSNSEATNGIHSHHDYVSQKMLKDLDPEIKKGDGIFALSTKEIKKLNLLSKEQELLKPYYSGTKEVRKYVVGKTKEYIIYTDSSFKDKTKMDNFPSLKSHLDQYEKVITSDNKPYGLHRSRNEDFFTDEKIISVRKCVEPTFSYSQDPGYFSATFYIIKSDRIDLKYLTTFLNSKIVYYWLRYKGKMQGDNFQVDKAPLLKIPIYKPESYFPFIELFELISATLKAEGKIIDVIENKHIAQFFEDVADACFFDVYFPEEMKEKEISVIEEVSQSMRSLGITQDFSSLQLEEQKKTIANLYMQLKESKAQQKMRRFVTASPDILKLILQS